MSEKLDSTQADHYNRSGLYAFVFSMTTVFVFMAYLVVFHEGVVIDEKVVDPNSDSGAAAAPAFDISTVSEPWVSSPEMITYGQKIYKTNCAMCHGEEAHGDGPAGMALNPRPRNLVEGKWTQGGGLTGIYKVISEGIPGTSMAAYKHFKSADRWALVHFIESITENKSTQSPEEVAEFAKNYKE